MNTEAIEEITKLCDEYGIVLKFASPSDGCPGLPFGMIETRPPEAIEVLLARVKKYVTESGDVLLLKQQMQKPKLINEVRFEGS